jgi:hypothetical protein
LDLAACPIILELVVGFDISFALLAPAFKGNHWGKRRWKNLDSILCIFYFKFFSCVIWGCTMLSFNIIPFPSKKY